MGDKNRKAAHKGRRFLSQKRGDGDDTVSHGRTMTEILQLADSYISILYKHL